MKKLLSVLFILLAIVGFAFAGGSQEAAPATPAAQATDSGLPTVKIGVVSGLDADGKITGYYYQFAMDLITEEAKAAAKDLGVNFEFIYRDYGGESSVLKQRMSELKAAGCVTILALCADDFGPAVAQWASENKTPVLFAANYSTQMSIVNYSDYIFATGLNAWGFIKVLASEAVGKKGYKTYAYVGTDGAGAIDAENLLLYEGRKYNPDFKCVASYRMSHTDTEFSTIVSTILSMKEIPEMTLQQGGYNVISFIMQASMYDFYDYSTIWSDVVIMPSIVTALVDAGVYSYKGSYGASTFAWWDPGFKDFYDKYTASTGQAPMDFALYGYWAGKAAVEAISACVKSGKDYTNGDVLTAALSEVEFESCGSKHSFRDIDHQLSMNIYFIEATDAGEEYNHIPLPADKSAVYTAEEYLPTKEEMKTYAETVLNVKNRF